MHVDVEIEGGEAIALRVREELARRRVNELKVALGERGEPWWTDGAPDYNKKLVGKTPYAEWYSRIARETRETQLFWPDAAESSAV